MFGNDKVIESFNHNIPLNITAGSTGMTNEKLDEYRKNAV